MYRPVANDSLASMLLMEDVLGVCCSGVLNTMDEVEGSGSGMVVEDEDENGVRLTAV
jgi:hypothetical protein